MKKVELYVDDFGFMLFKSGCTFAGTLKKVKPDDIKVLVPEEDLEHYMACVYDVINSDGIEVVGRENILDYLK